MDPVRREAAATMHKARRSLSEAVSLELQTPKQLVKLALQYPCLLTERRGDRHPVVVLPGLGASDRSTASLRSYLKQLGYNAYGWGLGTNSGNVSALVPPVSSLIMRLHEDFGKEVSLVGWSMGGVISREIAIHRPHLIRQVITMGSPIAGGPKYTAFADQLAEEGLDLDAIENHLRSRQRYSAPLKVPVTAIFSRRDGVVAWQACIDQANQSVEHVEVRSSHIGLGFDPDVYRIIARHLAKG